MRRMRTTLLLAVAGFGLLWLIAPVAQSPPAWGATDPHGGYTVQTDMCATCHRTHTAASPRLINTAPSGNAFCYSCHDGTGASATPIVSTHGNVDFAGVEADFALGCVSCHEPHGSPNLYSIRSDAVVEAGTPITVGPIVFAATTGPNSFDDGTSATSSRLCVACHESPDNQGYPMVDHVGAANHLGGANYEGQDCTGCHSHSADGTRENFDGFMPVGGCTTCHAVAQDNGDGVPVGGRRAVVPDFENNSHHVQGTVSDIDCVACHEMTQHQQGQVRLRDPDTGNFLLALIDRPEDDPAVAAALEPWCLACHDADGAGGVAPFQDAVMPPIVDATAWNAAQHGGSQTCYDCHRNGHGSDHEPILIANYVTADNTNFSTASYQLCFTCHIQNTVLGGSVQNAFNDYHDEHVLDRNAPCAHCHSPHAPYDVGESGLIDLRFGVTNLDAALLTGFDYSSAFQVTATTGRCYLACHGATHNPFSYTRVNPGNTTGGAPLLTPLDIPPPPTTTTTSTTTTSTSTTTTTSPTTTTSTTPSTTTTTSSTTTTSTTVVDPPPTTWDNSIANLLTDNCGACHTGAAPLGGLDIGTYQSALDGGNSGPGIVPGDPDASLIYTTQAAGGHAARLTDEQIAELLAWIEAGAPET